MAVSMRDVAKVAGVSQRTVSNVVNDYQHVSAETRQRVQEAIRRLNYRPNVSAQKLRNGRTGLVALAVPEIAAPYFAELADHLQRYAANRGVTLLIDQTGGTRERELQVLDGYRSTIIDGIILSPLAVTAEDLVHRSLDVPVVLLGESIDHCGFLHVSIDNVAAAAAATAHLLDRGRRRVAALGAHLSTLYVGPAERRLRGYVTALAERGMEVDPRLTLPSEVWTRRAGYQVVDSALADGLDVDAFFCFNDLIALGALKALHDHGVRVPDDIEVVGWDDIDEASFSSPTLTTIAPPKAEIAARAVDGLISSLNGDVVRTDELTCDFQLVIRESAPG